MALSDWVFNSRAVRTEPCTATHFLPKGYRIRVTPRYYTDAVGQPGAAVVAQPDVYVVVAGLANALGATAIVDLGCGRAGKLVQLSSRFDVFGVDMGSNLDFCRATYDRGTWIEADLEQGATPGLELLDLARAIVVSSDVIEHLRNPRPLLLTIGRLLDGAGAVVLSTPERVRTWGSQHMGPPPNLSHCREWSLDEFGQLLDSAGLRVVHLGLTRSNTLDAEGRTILAVCTGAKLTLDQVAAVEAAVSQVALHSGSGL